MPPTSQWLQSKASDWTNNRGAAPWHGDVSEGSGCRPPVSGYRARQRLDEQTKALRRDTATFLKGADAAHQGMSTEQRRSLAAERTRLASNATLRAGFQTQQDDRRAKGREAGRVWHQFNVLINSDVPEDEPFPTGAV